jgi:glycine cleavage system H protein
MSELVQKSGEFSQGRFWFTQEGAVVTIGFTSKATESLGELESLELPEAGQIVEKKEGIGRVEGTSDEFEIVAPFAGVVSEVNAVVSNNPSAVLEDPLEEGWLYQLEIDEEEDENEN